MTMRTISLLLRNFYTFVWYRKLTPMLEILRRRVNGEVVISNFFTWLAFLLLFLQFLLFGKPYYFMFNYILIEGAQNIYRKKIDKLARTKQQRGKD